MGTEIDPSFVALVTALVALIWRVDSAIRAVTDCISEGMHSDNPIAIRIVVENKKGE